MAEASADRDGESYEVVLERLINSKLTLEDLQRVFPTWSLSQGKGTGRYRAERQSGGELVIVDAGSLYELAVLLDGWRQEDTPRSAGGDSADG